MTRPRTIAALLCGVAVLALLLSVGVRDWWTYRDREVRVDVGLWSARLCARDAACAAQPVVPDRVGFVRVAQAAHLAGVAAAGLALVLGALALAERVPAGLGLATAFAGGLVAMLAIVVVALAPDALDGMPWGTGPAFALAGGACAVAAGLVAGRAPDAAAAGADDDPDKPPHPGVPAWFLAGVAGLALVFLALHTRTWWTEDNPTFLGSWGLRDERTCWKRDATDDAPAHLECEHATYRMTNVNPFPDDDRGRKRACAIGFQLGHLLAITGVLLLGFTAAGQRVPGAAQLVIGLALAFVIATAIAAIGRPSPDVSRSYGGLLGLAGAALLFGTSLAISREPRRARVYPRRR